MMLRTLHTQADGLHSHLNPEHGGRETQLSRDLSSGIDRLQRSKRMEYHFFVFSTQIRIFFTFLTFSIILITHLCLQPMRRNYSPTDTSECPSDFRPVSSKIRKLISCFVPILVCVCLCVFVKMWVLKAGVKVCESVCECVYWMHQTKTSNI